MLEPARDLAEQTHAHFETFSAHLTHPRVTSGLFVGGVDAKSQTETLRGGCDVAVGTPGRVLDLVESGALNLSGVRFFVLDEADRLLDAGNQGDLLRLFARMPRSGPGFKSLQVLLFSATLHSPEISKLATTLCREPTWVDLKGKEHVPDTVHHAVYVVNPGSEDPAALVPAAPVDNMHDESGGGGADGGARDASSLATKRLKPHVVRRVADALKMDQCLIFCRTNFDCDNLEAFLNACGGGGVFEGNASGGPQHAYSCAVLGWGRVRWTNGDETSARSKRATFGFSSARTSPRAASTFGVYRTSSTRRFRKIGGLRAPRRARRSSGRHGPRRLRRLLRPGEGVVLSEEGIQTLVQTLEG